MVQSGIAEAKQRGGGGQALGGISAQDASSRAEKAAPAAAASNGATAISGRIELAAALKDKVKADDVVFIFARPTDGQRMPLAAQRARVADLPMDFMLDDSQALMPEAKLSSAQQVRIEVRISKTGVAAPGKGDLTGQSSAVKPGTKGLRIAIDRVEP